mmetsp:Transcript_20843/g.53213  ORF Transcript_20843/g.53213 Transcript_20843/m.53213 type:complete len:260 (+) Transcript_20843:405-1184(+)
MSSSSPSSRSTSFSFPATTVSPGSILAAILRSSRASSSLPMALKASPRRKRALRFSPRLSTVVHTACAAAQSEFFRWQLARLSWHASLSSATAFLSAPVRSDRVGSTSAMADSYLEAAAVYDADLKDAFPAALAVSASSTAVSTASETATADVLSLAMADCAGAAGAVAARDMAGSACSACFTWARTSSADMFFIWEAACCIIAGFCIIDCACCIIAGFCIICCCIFIICSMSSGLILAIISCAAFIISGFIIAGFMAL